MYLLFTVQEMNVEINNIKNIKSKTHWINLTSIRLDMTEDGSNKFQLKKFKLKLKRKQ